MRGRKDGTWKEGTTGQGRGTGESTEAESPPNQESPVEPTLIVVVIIILFLFFQFSFSVVDDSGPYGSYGTRSPYDKTTKNHESCGAQIMPGIQIRLFACCHVRVPCFMTVDANFTVRTQAPVWQ